LQDVLTSKLRPSTLQINLSGFGPREKICQHVTPVNIPAGQSWRKSAVWKFTTADLKDGKCRATATFIPDNGKASVDFEITSVQ
jgi:hypothetical protein